MTLPQSGRLDGGEQPQGLPDERAQRLLAGTIFIPALDSELPLMGRDYGAGALLHIPPWRSHTLSPGRFRRCNGAGVPKLPRHGNSGFPREGADDFGHRIFSRSA
jgi:hypothetical protein